MAAFVEHKFGDSFLLDEERFRKLHNLINQRLTSFDANYKLAYKVYRGDSYSYDTTNIEDILNEENEDWRKLTKIKFVCNDIGLILSFDKEEVNVKIEADDRDRVFILFSDIRSYLVDEIMLKRKLLSIITSKNITFFIMIIMTSFFTYYLFSLDMSKELKIKPEEALRSTELNIKLDYLIYNYEVSNSFSSFDILPYFFGFMIWMLIVTLTDIIDKVIAYLFPKNIFLFGKQKTLYEKRKRFTDKFLWGILIAFIVSVLGGIVTKFM